MLPLRVTRDDVAWTGLGVEDERVTIWRDHDGAPAACCYEQDDQRWVALPGLGSFRFGHRPAAVEGFVGEHVPTEVVLDRYHRVVLPIVLQAFGNETLHASGVLTPGGVVALCGSSGAGKSTLACALGLRGNAVVADDSVVLAPTEDSITTVTLPFALRLLPETRQLLGLDEGTKRPLVAAGDPVRRPLSAIFMLDTSVEPDAHASIDVIPPAEGFRALLAHALCFSVHDSGRTRKMLQNYMTVASHVPVYRLRLRRGIEYLHGVLDELEGFWR